MQKSDYGRFQIIEKTFKQIFEDCNTKILMGT